MFARLRNAFYAEARLDGCSKIEFFGRLANAANRCLHREPAATAQLLCAAVLHEAFAIYDEMEDGGFEYLAVAFGNQIVDDYVDEARRSGFMSVDETMAFFSPATAWRSGMSSLALSLSNNARGFLSDLQPKQFKQVGNRIFGLARDPYPADCKHLSGHPGFRRIDVGEFASVTP